MIVSRGRSIGEVGNLEISCLLALPSFGSKGHKSMSDNFRYDIISDIGYLGKVNAWMIRSISFLVHARISLGTSVSMSILTPLRWLSSSYLYRVEEASVRGV